MWFDPQFPPYPRLVRPHGETQLMCSDWWCCENDLEITALLLQGRHKGFNLTWLVKGPRKEWCVSQHDKWLSGPTTELTTMALVRMLVWDIRSEEVTVEFSMQAEDWRTVEVALEWTIEAPGWSVTLRMGAEQFDKVEPEKSVFAKSCDERSESH